MRHRKAQELLASLALGELEPDEQRAVEQHVATCNACQAELDEMRQTFALLEDAVGALPTRSLTVGRTTSVLRDELDESLIGKMGSSTVEAPPRKGPQLWLVIRSVPPQRWAAVAAVFAIVGATVMMSLLPQLGSERTAYQVLYCRTRPRSVALGEAESTPQEAYNAGAARAERDPNAKHTKFGNVVSGDGQVKGFAGWHFGGVSRGPGSKPASSRKPTSVVAGEDAAFGDPDADGLTNRLQFRSDAVVLNGDTTASYQASRGERGAGMMGGMGTGSGDAGMHSGTGTGTGTGTGEMGGGMGMGGGGAVAETARRRSGERVSRELRTRRAAKNVISDDFGGADDFGEADVVARSTPAPKRSADLSFGITRKVEREKAAARPPAAARPWKRSASPKMKSSKAPSDQPRKVRLKPRPGKPARRRTALKSDLLAIADAKPADAATVVTGPTPTTPDEPKPPALPAITTAAPASDAYARRQDAAGVRGRERKKGIVPRLSPAKPMLTPPPSPQPEKAPASTSTVVAGVGMRLDPTLTESLGEKAIDKSNMATVAGQALLETRSSAKPKPRSRRRAKSIDWGDPGDESRKRAQSIDWSKSKDDLSEEAIVATNKGVRVENEVRGLPDFRRGSNIVLGKEVARPASEETTLEREVRLTPQAPDAPPLAIVGLDSQATFSLNVATDSLTDNDGALANLAEWSNDGLVTLDAVAGVHVAGEQLSRGEFEGTILAHIVNESRAKREKAKLRELREKEVVSGESKEAETGERTGWRTRRTLPEVNAEDDGRTRYRRPPTVRRPNQRPSRPADPFAAAEQDLRAGNLDQAKGMLNQIILETPEGPEASRARELVRQVYAQQFAQQAAEAADDPLPSAPRVPPPPVNPFVLTEKDNQSTFALEADTAAYTLARRYIRQGYLPPIGVVRMEEFVNAFDYNYPRQADQTFSVHSEAAPAPFGRGLVLLKIGIKGRIFGRDGRKPAHLVFVIDASGSMGREDRLPLIKYALTLLLDQLDAKDHISLIAYGTHARLLLEAVPATDKKRIPAALNAIECGASTNILSGIELGYQIAARHFAPGQVNRVILCSDGVANVGPSDAETLLKRVASYRDQGISFTSVGVGAGSYDDRLLEQLANKGDGNYIFIDSRNEAKRVFAENMSATIQMIAKDVKIQVEFNPKRVRRYRLIGYENRAVADKDFRNDAVDAGEIGSGQSATALYELELNRGSQDDLGTVYVRYKDIDAGGVHEFPSRLRSGSIMDRTPERHPRFFLAACVAEFAEILRGSEHARDGSLQELEQTMIRVANALPLDERVQELLLLTQKAQGLPRAK